MFNKKDKREKQKREAIKRGRDGMGNENLVPKRGLADERFYNKLKEGGSLNLPKRNERGVRIAKKNVIKGKPINPLSNTIRNKPIDSTIIEPNVNPSSIDWNDVNSSEYDELYGYISEQEMDGGIVGGKLIRPKYDSVELEKSIDTRIFELIPNAPAPLPDTVLRSIYQEALDRIDDLTNEVERLNGDIIGLNSIIQELEAIAETLRIELDNEKLKANIAREQADIANQQIAETTIDLQNAVQNSINEAIQRVSLTARNEALAQENESLREQLFGLSAQTAEGAKSGASNNFTVKVTNGNGDASQQAQDIWAKCSAKDAGSRKMTSTLEVANVTTDLKITNVAWTFDGSPLWFKVTGNDKVVEPEKAVTFGTEFDNEVIGKSKKKGLKPRRRTIGWKGKATNYKGLSLKCEVTFEDGTKDSVTLTTNLRKNRG